MNRRLNNMTRQDGPIDVAIIGGGEAGCHTALSLSKVRNDKGSCAFQITILEKKNALMGGTSRITPGRLGAGFHYSHLKTALKYLQETMSFMREYPDCVIGRQFDKPHPLRRGRYVIMKNSKPEPQEVLKIYQQLQEAYKYFVSQNPANKVWGDPETFCQIIYVASDQHDLLEILPHKSLLIEETLGEIIDLKNVACVVETCEELLDWKKYREITLMKLAQFSNIRVKTDVEVFELEHKTEQNFEIRYKIEKNRQVTFKTNFPVICAWERSERLIMQYCANASKKLLMTNRLKAIISVKLPSELLYSNSYFFCMGPYVMFSNLCDGTGKVTFAPVTNMQKFNAYDPISDEIELFLDGKADPKIKTQIAMNILNGAKAYIPLLARIKASDVIAIDFGIVKTLGDPDEVDISNPLGKISERDYGFVQKHMMLDGKSFIVQNDAMKIVYALKNAEYTKDIISRRCKQKDWN